MDLKETVWEVMDWIYLVQGREKWRNLVNLQFHKKSGSILD
jgi:hypothetical protein